MSIVIKNLRYEKPIHGYQVRVDRASVLGNPFYMCIEAQRDAVCDAYAEYFEQQLQSNKAFVNELQRLIKLYKHFGKLELFCWCAPKRCHAETIKQYVEAESVDILRDATGLVY